MITYQRNICSAKEHTIQVSNSYRVPTRSGVELGATITRPATAGKFPVLVWYDPYRSGADGHPSPMARYFARRGYAFVNLNVRGTGNSQGVSKDEYTVEETQDGYDAIAWLAEQPWSSGKVGMLGASYSGFNTLQVAATPPPALKAIAPAYFTDRRYTDDCHYKGGCLRGYYDMLTYGLNMVAMNALPPFKEAVGEQWSALWQARLEESEPYLLKWLAHPVEDDYWAVGSIAGQYHQIKAATMLIGGWHDGYVNPPLRIYWALQAPRKLLMGPWSHTYPDRSHCGPRINIYFELLRWWDHWLKDMDNGVTEEPAVQVYEQGYEPPLTDRTTIAGQWRMRGDLPQDEPQVLYLGDNALTDRPASQTGSASVPYLPAASRNGGLWDAGVPFTLPGEQTEDSARAINFTTPPLDSELAIFGNPTFSLFISADVTVIPVAVRLLEVAPDGTSVLVTKSILNTTRREGMDNPKPLVPGEITQVAFHLEATAWRFSRGNRIRVSINGSDFPNVWPTPQAGRLTAHWGPDYPSHITLPVWDGGQEPAFEFLASPNESRETGSGTAPWQVIHDVLEDRYRLVLFQGAGELGVSQRDPAQAWVRAKKTLGATWPGCEIRSEATGSLTSDADSFTMNLALNVYLNDNLYFQKRWSSTVPRQLL
jgi:putative CocE/NonD family hydrolase